MSVVKYYENDYELAVLEILQAGGWGYRCGYDIHRGMGDVVLRDDMREYLVGRYGAMSERELDEVVGYVEGYSNQSLYRAMKETYRRLMRGCMITRDDGSSMYVELFDYSGVEGNVFCAVNQYEFEEYKRRRPDVVLFVNGIPVSVMELKNPADMNVNIHDAYEQTHVRYGQDIPSLMKFDFVNVISDGANTRYGSLFAPYDFYFKWNSTDGESYVHCDGIESAKVMLNGLFERGTLLNVLHHYFYIPDNSDNNVIILPKYYQYYGAEQMFRHIVKQYRSDSRQGGTYWGATGCGKSYLMLFLSRRLTMCKDLEKPTIVLLTDRTDLDDQLSSDFENAKQYLVDDNCVNIADRKMLMEKLDGVQSGGIYLMTIQKFSEDVALLSNRGNIICISDEAHRTQTNTEVKYIMDERDGVKKRYGFAKYIRDSFPNAIYVGFTGTPVDATLRVFGGVVAKYTMQQSLDDGSTRPIGRISGPREVLLDEKIAKICDDYYATMAKEGANQHQIEQSKREMSTVKIILGNSDRLNIVVKHLVWHYEKRVKEHSTVNGKAMVVCYDREIAYEVYKRIKEMRPEWFVARKCAEEYEGMELSRDAVACEKVKLVCTNGNNDTAELSAVIGTSESRKRLAKVFKDERSNFKIAIVVDMWITGFDVPSLDTMYLDKPLANHNLIQTISRVNRCFEGKEEGLIVDYIGLENSIMQAMKMYEGDRQPVKGVDTSLVVFKDYMSRLMGLMQGYDYDGFFDEKVSPVKRLSLIQGGVEYVLAKKNREDEFMEDVKRAKKAYDICIGHEEITVEEEERLHYYMCVRSVIFKMTMGGTDDTTLMNQKIAKLVDEAVSSTFNGRTFDFEGEKENVEYLFSDEFVDQLKKIPYKNTRYQALLKMLKKAIRAFGKTNQIKAKEFSKRLQDVIDRYNKRNEISEIKEIIDAVVDDLSEELEQIHKELKREKESFVEMGITYDEKAFYDILVAVAEKYGFKEKYVEEYGDEKFIEMAKKIKKIVSNKSKYTDWTNRDDIKDELYTEVAILLNRNGYPPRSCDDTYDEIMKQVDNFKKYDD